MINIQLLTRTILLILTLMSALLMPALGAANAAGSFVIEKGVFHDKDRSRDVPYKLYRPDPLTGRYPIVIFSHGLGGSVEAAVYLGEHLANKTKGSGLHS